MKSLVPLLAMVPRWSMASCWLMPMPLSVMVRVLASLSKVTRTSRFGASSYRPALLMASKRSLSQASEALDTSSRRKISWVGIQRMGDKVQQLGHFGLEREGLFAHGVHQNGKSTKANPNCCMGWHCEGSAIMGEGGCFQGGHWRALPWTGPFAAIQRWRALAGCAKVKQATRKNQESRDRP